MKKISLRKVQARDAGRLLRWRNDPVTRRNSFSARLIKLSEHRIWFQNALTSSRKILLMAVSGTRGAVGFLRYDLLTDAKAEVNINLNPRDRGKGFGVKILKLGNSWLKKNSEVKKIQARIKKTNVSSQKAFAAAGFRLIKKASVYDVYEHKLSLSSRHSH